MASRRDARTCRQNRKGQGREARQRNKCHDHPGPGKGRRERQHPCGQKGSQRQRFQQGPAQIVQHLPAAKHRHAVAPATDDPGQKLPVAPGPAIGPAGIDVKTGRIFLDHRDIRGKARAGQNTLEQVMAQHRVVRHLPGKGRCKGIDMVDALAGKGPLAQQVLIDIRRRGRIGLDTTRTRRHAGKERALAAARQGRRHPRLQDAIAAGHLPGRRVALRPVQRMRHLADQQFHAVAQKPGIGVQRDDMAHPLRHPDGHPARRQKAGTFRTAQKAVKFA